MTMGVTHRTEVGGNCAIDNRSSKDTMKLSAKLYQKRITLILPFMT